MRLGRFFGGKKFLFLYWKTSCILQCCFVMQSSNENPEVQLDSRNTPECNTRRFAVANLIAIERIAKQGNDVW